MTTHIDFNWNGNLEARKLNKGIIFEVKVTGSNVFSKIIEDDNEIPRDKITFEMRLELSEFKKFCEEIHHTYIQLEYQ